jgi:hypothetical protein
LMPHPPLTASSTVVAIIVVVAFVLCIDVAAARSSLPPGIESAQYSARRATLVGRYGGTVVSEVYRFLDVTFPEPMYARVDNLLCPAAAAADTGQATSTCVTSSARGASCGNFTSSSSTCLQSNHTCLVVGQGTTPPPKASYHPFIFVFLFHDNDLKLKTKVITSW